MNEYPHLDEKDRLLLLILENQRAIMWELWATSQGAACADQIDATDAAINQLKGEKDER